MSKLPVGTRVVLVPAIQDRLAYGIGTILYHGQDAGGTYTAVRWDNGSIEQWHRDAIQPIE